MIGASKIKFGALETVEIRYRVNYRKEWNVRRRRSGDLKISDINLELSFKKGEWYLKVEV